jgi:hypothetical protein
MVGRLLGLLDGTQAIIVIQDDAILHAKYLNGTQLDSMMTSFSVAKTFTTALEVTCPGTRG